MNSTSSIPPRPTFTHTFAQRILSFALMALFSTMLITPLSAQSSDSSATAAAGTDLMTAARTTFASVGSFDYRAFFVQKLAPLFSALVILVVGWLVARLVGTILAAILRKTGCSTKIAAALSSGGNADGSGIERGTCQVGFWFVMLFVLVAFFQALGLTPVTEPLNVLLSTVLGFIPQIFGAAILAAVGFVLATVVKKLLARVFASTKLDEKVSSQAGSGGDDTIPLATTLSETAYWLILLFFLPMVLSALSLDGLLAPIQEMIAAILGVIPHILAAGVTFAVGWFVARIVMKIVSNLLATAGLDRAASKAGLDKLFGDKTLSGLIGLIFYVSIIIVALVIALERLQLDAITDPATAMIGIITSFVPQLLGGFIVIGVAYFVGRLLRDLVTGVLRGIGFDRLYVWLGIKKEPAEGAYAPSTVVGNLIMVALLFLAVVQALNLLELQSVATYASELLIGLFNVLVALVLFGLGLFVANKVSAFISGSNGSKELAVIARIAILVFSGFIALHTTGLGTEIVTMAFGIILGAAGIAAAIAFGIGGKDVAARYVAKWSNKMDD